MTFKAQNNNLSKAQCLHQKGMLDFHLIGRKLQLGMTGQIHIGE